MRTFIRNLRSKSDRQKKSIRFFSLVVLMIIVGCIWAYSLGDRFSSSAASPSPVTQADSDQNQGPFAVISNSFKDAYHNIAASVGNISFGNKDQALTPDKQIELRVINQ